MLNQTLPRGAQCDFYGSITTPLYEPHSNTINPCFISAANLVFNVLIGLLGASQLWQQTFNNHYGPHPIRYSFGSPFKLRSVGLFQLAKLNSIFLQILLFVFLLDFTNVNGAAALNIAWTLIVTTFVFLPMQIYEPTRSPVTSASSLLFWTFNTVFYAVILSQDIFSSQKVWVPVGSSPEIISVVKTVETCLAINSLVIFVLQYYLYRPSVELKEYWDLNDWSLNSVHDIYSNLGLFWLRHYIRYAYYAEKVTLKDVPDGHIDITSGVSLTLLNSYWNDAVKKSIAKRDARLKKISKPTPKDQIPPRFSLFWIFIKMFWRESLKIMIIDIAELGCTLARTYLVKQFIQFFSDSTSSSEKPVVIGITISILLFISSMGSATFFNVWRLNLVRIKAKLRSSLMTKIYQKAISLSPEARKHKPSGDIITNLAVDVTKIGDSFETLSDIITMPVRLISALVALYALLGLSTISGLVAALVLIPLSSYISNSISKFYTQIMNIKDTRARLTSEILTSIKSIKLFAWEQPMLKRLFAIRNDKELRLARKIGLYNSFATFTWMLIPFTMASVCFITYTYFGPTPLVPTIVFPALTLFELITEPILIIPNVYADAIEINVALKRVRKLFLLEEINTTAVERTFSTLNRGENSVEISNATFLWKSETDSPINDEEHSIESAEIALSDINLTAKKGELTCIVGRVGSGKSTILKALLGEVILKHNPNSHVKVNGTMAYCDQNPWLANASVRENILFGSKFDPNFYQKTISACQLLPDLEVLPDGERTIVGEKGISLSGGQKARVSLARAVYSRADVIILDDILSAVDSHVGKNIIKEVLGSEGILSSKTIILATNAVNVLAQAGMIYLVQKGKITESCSYKSAITRQSDLAKIIEEFGEKKKEEEDATSEANEINDAASISSNEVAQYNPEAEVHIELVDEEIPLTQVRSKSTLRRASFVSVNHDYNAEEESEENPPAKTGHTQEITTKGRVNKSIYLEYFKACNFSYVLFYIACFGAYTAAELYIQYLCKLWSEQNLSAGHNVHSAFYLTLYVSLGFSGCFATLLGYFVLWYYCVISGSKYFHDTMAKRVLRSPMSFFETTPVGRVINRFADDMNSIDERIIWAFIGVVDFSLGTVGVLVVIVINLPIMALVILGLAIIYNEVRRYFISSQRELKRIESALKSPVFAHLQESLSGISTIRAYDQISRFAYRNIKDVDTLVRVFYMNVCCGRWLSMRLQFISALVSFASSLLILATLGTSKQLSPGTVGFLMVNALAITGHLNTIIRYWAQIENESISVERVVEFCNLTPEADPIIESNRPSESWPSRGEIKFVDYSVKYRPNLDPVLKNISLNVKPGEKIGIVGRTGAGKSTLSLALFRIIEASNGHIEIDGVDTSKIGLYDLRHKLNIIPQDSHAIEGSVRDNLDPFGNFTDDQLWRALELASLKEHVQGMKNKKKQDDEDVEEDDDDDDDDDTENEAEAEAEANEALESEDDVEYEEGLAAQVFEGGSNLSAGQKQLLSLARSLLNPSQVLVLDEATAAVDAQTDKIIQKTIRSEFGDRTILTIAHRLDTVLDSDRVLVLGNGEVKEFDTPKILLADKTTIFHSLCQEGGYLENLDFDSLK